MTRYSGLDLCRDTYRGFKMPGRKLSGTQSAAEPRAELARDFTPAVRRGYVNSGAYTEDKRIALTNLLGTEQDLDGIDYAACED